MESNGEESSDRSWKKYLAVVASAALQMKKKSPSGSVLSGLLSNDELIEDA